MAIVHMGRENSLMRHLSVSNSSTDTTPSTDCATASERRRAHPISPEEALRRLRDIQQSLEEYLQGTSTSLELPSSGKYESILSPACHTHPVVASPFSPGLVDLPSPHSRNPDHDNVEVDSLAAELSLIHEVFRRLQARARQIEAIQRERREAGTGAAPAVRSAWVTLTRGPESRSQTASEAGEPSSSRPVAVGMLLLVFRRAFGH